MSDQGSEPVGVGERDGHRHDVFLSYSSKDKTTADLVCAILEGQGIRCWMAPRDIIPGEDWAGAIIDAIEETRAFVLIFSGFSNVSSQVKREVERAANHNRPIIPFRIEEVTPSRTLEFFISTPHWLDALTPPMEQHVRELARNVTRLLGDVPEASVVTLTEAVTAARTEAAKTVATAPPPEPPEPPEDPETKLETAKVAGASAMVTAVEDKVVVPPAPRAPMTGVMATAIAAAAFLAVELAASGTRGIAAPLVGMPVFMAALAIGLGLGGWLGPLGTMVLVVAQSLMWIATVFVGAAAVEISRHAYTGGFPLSPQEYLVGGLTFFTLQAAGFYALIMLLGRGLAQPATLRVAGIYSLALGAAGGGFSCLVGGLRIQDPGMVVLGVPVMLVWLLVLASGAFGVAGGSPAPLLSAAGRAALASLQGQHRGAAPPPNVGWVLVSATAVVALVTVLLGLELATSGRYQRPHPPEPVNGVDPVGGTQGGGGQAPQYDREVRSPYGYRRESGDTNPTAPAPDEPAP